MGGEKVLPWKQVESFLSDGVEGCWGVGGEGVGDVRRGKSLTCVAKGWDGDGLQCL